MSFLVSYALKPSEVQAQTASYMNAAFARSGGAEIGVRRLEIFKFVP